MYSLLNHKAKCSTVEIQIFWKGMRIYMENYVITIARGFGSGGKEIGSKLAQRLNIPCYESQILTLASEQSGLAERLFRKVDEKLQKHHFINKLSKMKYNYKIEPQDKKFDSDVNLFNIQAKIITELSENQSCVIIGKCADYILKNTDNTASFYIEAPRSACLKSITEKMGISEKEANKLITKTDKYRADYYAYYTGGNYWTNPVNYDMTINSFRVGREKTVDLLEMYIKLKFNL